MKTAAEWLKKVERTYTSVIPGVMDSSELADMRALLAMLRDAKAELEQARRELDRDPVFRVEAGEQTFVGWDAIERKWREGRYR